MRSCTRSASSSERFSSCTSESTSESSTQSARRPPSIRAWTLSSFLPGSAESPEVVRKLNADFPEGETATGIVVYKQSGGLTPADQQKILADARAIQAAGKDKIDLVRPPVVPFAPGSPPNLVSKDGSVATTLLTVPTNFEKEANWGKAVRDIVHANPGDMQVYVTGGLGLSVDANDVFGNIDTTLLLATVILVLVLLGAI